MNDLAFHEEILGGFVRRPRRLMLHSITILRIELAFGRFQFLLSVSYGVGRSSNRLFRRQEAWMLLPAEDCC